MAVPQPSAHTLNLTPERLESARKWLRANAPTLYELSAEAVQLAALGLLICDGNGFVGKGALASAMSDHSAIAAADVLVKSALC